MDTTDSLTKYEFARALIRISEANGISAKYVRDGDCLLNRYECALLCQRILHLSDCFRELPDLPEQARYAGAVGAVLEAGILSVMEGRFQGQLLLTRDDAERALDCTDRYLKRWRGSFRPFQATAIQFNPRIYHKEENIFRLYAELEKAFAAGARLVLAPETVISAYVYTDRKEIAPYVEAIPGPLTDHFAALAKKYNGYLAFGVAEVDPDNGSFYNTAVLIGPKGYVGKYRKMHQWETEKHWAADGDLGVPVFSTELGNLAMIICIDSTYYEAARLAAVSGADIILYLTCDSGQAIWSVPARAAQNGVYMISANRTGEEKGFTMVGASSIWGPEGDKLAEGELVLPGEQATFETQHVSAVIYPARFDNPNKRRLLERRPEFYRELKLNISPWDKRKSLQGHDVNALAIQYTPVPGDKKANQEKIRRLAAEAWTKDRSVNLIVLPELSLTGPFVDSGKQAEAFAEEMRGESCCFFAELAKEYRSVVVFSMAEQAAEGLYHTAVILEKDGSLLGVYRKIHRNDAEKRWALSGSRVETFMSRSIGRIGVLLGDEYLYPEVYGLLQIKRADIIVMPQAYAGGGGRIEANPRIPVRAYPENAVLLWDAIAIGAQAYLVVANYTGGPGGYAGGSGLYSLEPIYGKDRPILCGREEIAFAVHFETLAAERWWMDQEKMIITRRPVFYDPLIL